MRAPGRDAGSDPFAFRDLPFDRKMKIGVGLPDAKDVGLGTFNADGMSLTIQDFGICGGDQAFDQVDVTRVDDVLIVSPHDRFIVF